MQCVRIRFMGSDHSDVDLHTLADTYTRKHTSTQTHGRWQEIFFGGLGFGEFPLALGVFVGLCIFRLLQQ